MSNKMKEHLKESLRILKDHCINRDNCEGCELEDVCECLFDINIHIEDWELD